MGLNCLVLFAALPAPGTFDNGRFLWKPDKPFYRKEDDDDREQEQGNQGNADPSYAKE